MKYWIGFLIGLFIADFIWAVASYPRIHPELLPLLMLMHFNMNVRSRSDGA